MLVSYFCHFCHFYTTKIKMVKVGASFATFTNRRLKKMSLWEKWEWWNYFQKKWPHCILFGLFSTLLGFYRKKKMPPPPCRGYQWKFSEFFSLFFWMQSNRKYIWLYFLTYFLYLQGDAVFWYNLHHDGSGDYDTRHAACPVLIGEKWGE